MWLRFTFILLLLPALFGALPATAASIPPWGTGESRGEDLAIGLAIFAPGTEVPSWWGHAALIVEDRERKQARLYNYGMFDFEKFARFAMGRLEFWVADAPVRLTFGFYAREDRDIRIQWLNLNPQQRERIAKHLADNVLPANRDYLYDHYGDNCSTRLRDAIDLAVGGQLRDQLSAPGRMTIREHTRRFTSVNTPMRIVLDFMMNDSIDKPVTQWDEAFLPAELERAVERFEYTDPATGKELPLLERVQTVHASKTRSPVPADPPNDLPGLLGLGLVWAALLLGFAHLTRGGKAFGRRLLGAQVFLTGLLVGLPGTVLLIMWLVTDHTVTFRNENLFLANPLTLLLVWLGVRVFRGRRPNAPQQLLRVSLLLVGIAGLGLLLKVLPMFDQNNWNIVALLLPIWLGLAGAAGWWVRSPATAPETRTEGGPQWRTT